MPKVSVIVPIYGVEKYISRCAISLMEQSLEDMEFIFVNDCTKDKSIDVLEHTLLSYPSRRSQVRIISKQINEGVSYARKTGLENACGEYIGFCDSDDWVAKTMYEKLYEKAIRYDLDYVKCGHIVSDGINDLSYSPVRIPETTDRKEVIAQLLRCRGGDSIWDTITKRDIYNKSTFEFTKNAMLEDFFLAAQIIENSSSFGVVNESLYYYFKNPESICNVPSEDAFIKRGKQSKDNIEWILNYFHSKYGDSFKKDEVVLKNIPRRIIIPIMKDPSYYSLWSSFYPGNSWKYLCSPYVSPTLKIQYLLVVLHLYPLYKRFR